MTRLKDEVIEDASKLGEIIDLCKDEIANFEKYKRYVENQDPLSHVTYEEGVYDGRKELVDAILKILGLLPE